MQYNTSELCDLYADMIDVVEPIFANYGGRRSFGGVINTIKCFEDNGYRDWETDRKSTRLNSSHLKLSRMPSSA